MGVRWWRWVCREMGTGMMMAMVMGKEEEDTMILKIQRRIYGLLEAGLAFYSYRESERDSAAEQMRKFYRAVTASIVAHFTLSF